jgi:GR25 family glycosyltransferase involved in LPS biosynthesis
MKMANTASGFNDDEAHKGKKQTLQYKNAYVTLFANEPVQIGPLAIRTKAELDFPEFDPNTKDVTERGYPKNTHLVDYMTSATEREIEKHDRFLVQGMYFMRTHDFEPLSQTIDRSKKEIEKKVCLNIYLCNRRIPYINALLMGLSSYSSKETEKDILKAEIHLLNTEKRKERLHFRYLKDKLSKLPFVHEVHNITYRDEIYRNITDRELIFREMFISDEISGLKICLESGFAYCIMMEEDAVVPVDFMTLLDDQVIAPLEKEGVIRIDGSGSISVLSLYSYYNLVTKGHLRLHYPSYTKRQYDKDATKMNSERFSRAMPPFRHDYEITEQEYMYGTVAMMYTRDSAQKLVNYLQKVGVDPIHNADEFMNADEYFPSEIGIPRKHVQPSLVNHIGYYSERMANFKARGMFSQLNTDSRFMFDPGDF